MEAKPSQLSFPEPISPARTLTTGTKEKSTKPPTKDKPKFYRLAEGTTLRSGPLGGTGEVLSHIHENATARVLRKIIIDGMVSFFVEVESPPEQKGRYWVTKRFGGGRGFL